MSAAVSATTVWAGVMRCARTQSGHAGWWRALRAVHDPGKIVAGLTDVREGYRLENCPLVGAQRGPYPLQRLGRSRVRQVFGCSSRMPSSWPSIARMMSGECC
ncbi:MAG TPA: hypothetical protein VME19_12525 [Streptosporangiaceae bacterium]|nr:hypothetical protein [Streptosporangiaceae bacterium]